MRRCRETLNAGDPRKTRDGTKTIAGNAVAVTKLNADWYNFNASSIQQLQPAVERYVGEWVWNSVFLTVLEQPTWLVLGILGAILILLGRRKKPLIGYGRD